MIRQNTLRYRGHVLRKQEDDWVKKYINYEQEVCR